MKPCGQPIPTERAITDRLVVMLTPDIPMTTAGLSHTVAAIPFKE